MRDEMEQYRRQETYRDLIDAELVPGETVIWQQAPEQGARVRGSVITRIFGLFWLAFSLVWEAFALTAASAGGPALTMIFPIFGLPFVAIGVWLVFLMPTAVITLRRLIHMTRNKSRLFFFLLPT